MSETAAEGTAVKGRGHRWRMARSSSRRAQGGLVLGGLDEALPRAECTAWPGWPSSDARAGPSTSNPTLDRVKMFVKTYVRHLVRIFFSSACVAGRSCGMA